MPLDEAVTRQSVILELFMRQAISAGGQVTIADGAASAALLIAGMAKGQVKCSATVSKDHPEVYSILEAESTVESINDEIAGGDEDRTRLAETLAGGVGVVVAVAGVAETGSVVLADNSLSARLLGMLADICIVLPRSSILRDLDEAGALIADLDRRGHRYISLVTGPSRTADIERVLTIGVQGPRALHVIVF